MALVSQLGDAVGLWQVPHVAIWHWYLPLCVYVTFKKKNCFFPFVFFLFFFMHIFVSDIDKSDESSRYQDVLALCTFFFFKQGWYLIDYFFENLCLMFACCCFFMFVFGLVVWILKNFAVSWLLCGISRRWIDVCFQLWCNPLRLTGLEASTS